ncbi:hypothetical protein Hdeb2414_s0021g00568961 [Helianthus debilis subsp. tardiflorus]
MFSCLKLWIVLNMLWCFENLNFLILDFIISLLNGLDIINLENWIRNRFSFDIIRKQIFFCFFKFGYPFRYPNPNPKFRISENRISEISDSDSDVNIQYPKFSDIRFSDIRKPDYPILNTPS